MQTHNLSPKTKTSTKKTVGRGGTRGKTSGRGHKGQKARAGNSTRPASRDIIKKLPKLRGYRFNSRHQKPQVVNLAQISDVFAKGETVSPKTLADKGLVRNKKGSTTKVKVLGNGDLAHAVAITDCQVSDSARDKITKAGGTIN